MNNAKQVDLGNNETATIGLVPQQDGRFLALTLVDSKTFKTRKGAAQWLARRGYAEDGSRL